MKDSIAWYLLVMVSVCLCITAISANLNYIELENKYEQLKEKCGK